ncbi:MAG: acyltransferase family protein [Bacteroidetes bacterium]|nr:acyltransferase family protein [Bacteroidota bacterium]
MNKDTRNATSSDWIRGLDSIRFFLAFIVLLAHFQNPFVAYFKSSSFWILNILGGLLSVSFCGIGAVIGFFIVSGFVIHYPNRAGIPSVKKFLIRRWMRIGLPLAVISCIGFSIGHFDFIPIWSLYCELIYYTIYPILSKIQLSWRTKFVYAFLLALLFIFFLTYHDLQSFIFQKDVSFSGLYWQLGTGLTWIIGLPCWLLGVLLAERIDTHTANIRPQKIWIWRMIVLIISVVLVAARFRYFLSYIISMNFFGLLLFGWIRAEILYFKVQSPLKFLERLGGFSYSIYLCHAFCFYVLYEVIPLTIATYGVFIVITLFISYLFYLAVEKPSHKLAKFVAQKVT